MAANREIRLITLSNCIGCYLERLCSLGGASGHVQSGSSEGKALSGNDLTPQIMENRCRISNFTSKSPGRAVQRSSILSTLAAASVGTRAFTPARTPPIVAFFLSKGCETSALNRPNPDLENCANVLSPAAPIGHGCCPAEWSRVCAQNAASPSPGRAVSPGPAPVPDRHPGRGRAAASWHLPVSR